MDRSKLPARLVAWCQKIGDSDLLNAAVHIASVGDLSQVPRDLLERVRDRLARAQERNQFSDEADQQDLANVIAALDEVRALTPTN